MSTNFDNAPGPWLVERADGPRVSVSTEEQLETVIAGARGQNVAYALYLLDEVVDADGNAT